MPPGGDRDSPEHTSPEPLLRPAVFLDRDGTLIEERNYPSRPEDIVPLPGTGPALQRLASLGFLRIVLTNQSAVARGMLTEEGLAELHAHLVRQLNASGGGVDAIYYCPHHPEGIAVGYNHVCSCRKPKQGLLDMALKEHGIDLSRSIFIGDALRDLFVDAGPAAGRLLVQTGHAIGDTTGADAVVPSLVEATEWILERYGRRTIAISIDPPPDETPVTAEEPPPEPGPEAEDAEHPPAKSQDIEPPTAGSEDPEPPPSGDVSHESGTDEPSSPHGQA